MSFSWQDVWRLIKRWWWLAVIGVVLAGGTSYYFASKKPNIYAARTRLMVGSGIRSTTPDSRDFGLSLTLAGVYAEIVRLRPVTQGVIDRLQLPIEWWELAARIQTRVIPSAQVLEITVLDTNPEFAAAMANAVADELIRQSPATAGNGVDREFILQELADSQAKIEETQAQIDALRDGMLSLTSAFELEEARTRLEELEQLKVIYRSTYVELASILNTQSPNTLTVVEPASPPGHPVAPNPKKEALMAAVAGLALAIAAIGVFEFADDTLRIHDAGVGSVMGLPILGAMARMPGDRCEPRSPAAEMVRQLRTKVILSGPNGRLRSLVITSPMPKDGKTVVAANLAVAVAAARARAVLIDADLRAPSLHEWFDQPNVAGLADLLSADRAQCERLLPQLLRDTDVPGLSFLSAGCPPLDPAALLTSPRMPDLLVMLSKQFDFVLFDSPPVLLAPDATILAMVAEGTLLVVSPGKASRKATRRSIDKLTSCEDAHLIGVALNRMPLSRYAYHYAHRKGVVPRQGSPAGLFHRLTNSMSSLPLIGRSANSDLASLSQAASMLGVHRKTVKRWCQEGRLPGVKKRLRWWVKQDGLESMVLSQMATKTSLDIQALDGIQSEEEDSSDGRSMSASPQQPEEASGYETTQEALSEAVKT